jgi:5-methylcytosine-specific restriction endonuclease McrA
MDRSRPLRSDPDKVRAWRARSRPLRSKGRGKMTGADKTPIREAVFRRDSHRCQLADLGGCFGGLTPHHRRKASQGGGYNLANLATLCAHHNDELEADADLARLARERGLVVRRGDSEWETLGS